MLVLIGMFSIEQIVIIAAILAIVFIAVRAMGLEIPAWVIQIICVVIIAIVAIMAVRFVSSL